MLKRKVYSNTRPHWQLALEMRTSLPYGWFWKFFGTVSLKAHDSSSWILAKCNLSLKNCEIPHSVRGLWCIKSMKGWFTCTPPDLLARICKVNLSNAKEFGLICFRGLIYCDQEPLWLLNVIEDGCCLLGVHIRLSTRCKMFDYKIT